MKILHLFPNEKFTVDYVERIKQLFDFKDHTFYIFNNQTRICNSVDLPYDNVHWGEITDDSIKIRKLIEENDRIILHNLTFNWFQLKTLILFQKKLAKPYIWAIWGSDLYNEYKSNHLSLNPKRYMKECKRKKLIKNLYGVVACDDYPELLKRYKTTAKNFYAMYTYKFIKMMPYKSENNLIRIMVGHSATDTCRHIDVFEKLKSFTDQIMVYCPLSYPDNKEYIRMVIERGNELFGKHFIPITKFMKYPEYVEFLNQIDIGIFNNNRQQGNGNITNLLYLGKKVYMATENTLLKTYRDLGAVIYNYSQIEGSDLLMLLPDEVAAKNHQVVVDRYSDNNFYSSWNRVFTE
jgi:hypothetical protein